MSPASALSAIRIQIRRRPLAIPVLAMIAGYWLLTADRAEAAAPSAVANAPAIDGVSWTTLGLAMLATAIVVAGLAALRHRAWAHKHLGAAPSDVVAAMNRVAQGDLTFRVAGAQDNLLGAIHQMAVRLSDSVAQVREGAQTVVAASAQIAQGNLDLSSRTEMQASALQETSASMEELGSTVSNNAANASRANDLSRNASAVAMKGGAVVSQVVDTMKGINDSSRRIADIIAVIDAIAFQTNILALNAAVESARAGEQGRGFAVVATEVRNLAQRSAAAAQEIKALITESVARVETGSGLVNEAGSTMQEIVKSIQDVTGIVGEISSASEEQSTGVAQVGRAISQMDQATQKNTALVEESAAAAESLRQQAEQLLRAVSAFQLVGGEHQRARPVTARPVLSPAMPSQTKPQQAGTSGAGAKPVNKPLASVASSASAAPRGMSTPAGVTGATAASVSSKTASQSAKPPAAVRPSGSTGGDSGKAAFASLQPATMGADDDDWESF